MGTLERVIPASLTPSTARIDRIYTQAHASVWRWQQIGSPPTTFSGAAHSDHLPVVARIALAKERPPSEIDAKINPIVCALFFIGRSSRRKFIFPLYVRKRWGRDRLALGCLARACPSPFRRVGRSGTNAPSCGLLRCSPAMARARCVVRSVG
eukprot:scaffold6770_cov125-Isochrysis_galbana.AAC.6